MNQPPLLDYSAVNSLPEVWHIAAQQFKHIIALHDPHSKPEVKLTYADLYEQIQQFAIGLQTCGVQPASKVALFADNSPRWLIADQGIMAAGAANIVRSSGAEKQELFYILEDSDSNSLIVENLKTWQKLRSELDRLPIKLVILLSDESTEIETSYQLVNFSQLMAAAAGKTLQPVEQNRQTLATLIYTSGTTGKPKGAMLSHGNLLHQVVAALAVLQPQPEDLVLSILPSWHAYERSCEYFLLSQGCTQIYTNLRSFKKDLKRFQPNYMVGVPRLWESLHEGIQKQLSEQSANQQKLVKLLFSISEKYIVAKRIASKLSLEHLEQQNNTSITLIQAAILSPLHSLADKLVYSKIRQGTGGKIKGLISGGGSLAMFLDDFYEIVGIPVYVGYGLTETSPIATCRTPQRNLRGSAGLPLPETEIRIVDPDTRETLKPLQRGLVLIRGSQIMQGYYKRPEATAKAIDAEGWFDSGDLGLLTANGDLVLTGRAKDTIVLTNGENIEPQPLEDACLRSPYIDQIVLVGQDRRSLGAIIVPNLEMLENWAKSQQLALKLPKTNASIEEVNSSDLKNKVILDLFRQELNREVQNRSGYRADDRISSFELILEPFSQENGMMTQTLKIKRPIVMERYSKLIDKMFA